MLIIQKKKKLKKIVFFDFVFFCFCDRRIYLFGLIINFTLCALRCWNIVLERMKYISL